MKTNNMQQRVKRNLFVRTLFVITIAIFSVAFISAQTPLEEFMNTWDLEVTISQDDSTANFNMDLKNTSFDKQDFTFGDITIENVYLSSLLEGIDFKARTEKGWNYTLFDEINIIEGSTTQFLLDNVFVSSNINLTCEEMNNNVSLFNEFLLRHPLKYSSDRTITLEKSGTNYQLFTNTGLKSVDKNYRNQIVEILKESIYSVNIKSLLNKVIPLTDYNLSFLEDLDLDYQITILNLDEIEVENGEYNVEVQITHENTNITKTIKLILKDIPGLKPVLFCGDGICNNGETCSTCSNDCGKCSSTTHHGSSSKYIYPTKIIPNKTVEPGENKTNEKIITKLKEKSFWEKNKIMTITIYLLVLILVCYMIYKLCKNKGGAKKFFIDNPMVLIGAIVAGLIGESFILEINAFLITSSLNLFCQICSICHAKKTYHKDKIILWGVNY